jgi:hypothetical protein
MEMIASTTLPWQSEKVSIPKNDKKIRQKKLFLRDEK